MAFKKQIKNILIVNPKTPMTYWSFDAVFRFLGSKVKSAHSSNVLALLPALVPYGYVIRLLDGNAVEITDADFEWADVVLITGWDIHREQIRNLIWRCRAYNKPAIVGGAFASTTPEARELAQASSVFIGEAIDRKTFGQLFTDLDHGDLKPRYYADLYPEIINTPTPRYDLLDFPSFVDVTMQFSIGCPFRCEFCAEWKLAGPPRYKTVVQIFAELQALYETGYRGSVFVVDDNFTGDERVSLEICQAITVWQKRHGNPFSFYGEGDLRMAKNETLVRAMAGAGFRSMFIGIESASDKTLREMRKHHNVGVDIGPALSRLRSWGIDPYCGLILGTDSNDQSSFSEMIEFVQEVLCAPRSMVGLCVAMEGTDLRARIKREGRLIEDVHGEQFDLPNIWPNKMSLSELVAGHVGVMSAIYDASAYFARARRSLNELLPVHRFPVGRRELRAAALSLIIQGVFAPYKREYWKFLLGVFEDNPSKIGQAFAAAIVYAHFHGYTNELRARLPGLLTRVEQIVKERRPKLVSVAG